jgi:hemerythrin superfamily protein
MAEQGRTGKDAGSGSQAEKETATGAKAATANLHQGQADPVAMLTADHRKVEALFAAFRKAPPEQKAGLVEQICTELTIHTLLEEEIFYPACHGHVEDRLLDEAQVEHDGAKALIVELQSASPADRYYDAKVKVLAEEIKHHVAEEEKPKEGILAKAKEAGVTTAELARRLAERKSRLMDQAERGDLDPPQPRSFRIPVGRQTSQMQENTMARHSTMLRERDEMGRFVSDDDDRDYRRGRSRYDDDDDRRGGHGGWHGDPEGHAEAARRGWDEREDMPRGRYRDDDDRRGFSRSNYRERDEMGRFVSDDDDGYYRRGRSSRYDDDDDRRGGRGHGGWFGDPEGHARAARRGWDEREGMSRSRYRDDDDDDRRRYARDYPDRDERGRFVGDDDDRRRGGRGHGGWFGDPEGHAEAARRGWDEREGASRGRYRRDDDDDRRSGRRHGGWYGDPEGHSEASRRGWDDRR